MTRDPICVTADMSARELGETLDVNEVSGAPVVDAAERLVGVVSKSDLIHRCVEELLDEGTGTMWSSASASDRIWEPYELGVVSDIMSSEPITATPDEPLADVAGRMAERRIHRVVVVDDEGLVTGVLTTLDVIGAIARTPARRKRLKMPKVAIERRAA
jgi:CBS domain-containing protein